jgi:hypothetical protein
LQHYLVGKSASIRVLLATHVTNQWIRDTSHHSSPEHYSDEDLHVFQVGMIQMAADKNNV